MSCFKTKLGIFFIVLISFYGCGKDSDDTNISETTWYRPSVTTTFQWQLNGELDLSYNVDLYDIDLFDTNSSIIEQLHDENKSVICYFSAGSYENWRNDANSFPENILGNNLDDWEGERWLDISNLNALRPIIEARLDLAQAKGCDGVEPDNIDGYINNTGFELTAEDQINYNKYIAQEAHKRGLSVGLKNDLNQIEELESYFDFAINEQCNFYNECDKLIPFIEANKPVFNIEYDSKYITQNDVNQTLCNYTNNLHFQTLVLPHLLDDSFRYSCNPTDRLFNIFGVGFGSSSSFEFQDDDNNSVWVSAVDLMLDSNIAENDLYKNIKDFNGTNFTTLQQHLSNVKYFTMWITKGWEETWFDIDKINEAVVAGKIPVFIYWYFGDNLVNGMPTSTEIEEYIEDNHKLKIFLDKINGTKVVILEPEFNKQSVLDNATLFTTIISDAIDIIKDNSTKISLCMTDTGNRGVNQTYEKCGYENCALGDKYEWRLPKPIYDALLDKIDFISFQEMLGQFSRDPQNPGSWDSPNPITYTNDELGISYLPQRLENMSSYLYELYKKPIFLPYITIATATWSDDNNDDIVDTDEVNTTGYEDIANEVYKNIDKSNLFTHHLFGYSVMELFDEPKHDFGGYQFFIKNEYHLGIIKSSAVDEEDSKINGDIEFKKDILENIF